VEIYNILSSLFSILFKLINTLFLAEIWLVDLELKLNLDGFGSIFAELKLPLKLELKIIEFLSSLLCLLLLSNVELDSLSLTEFNSFFLY
jgi:hypothetical protein